MTYQPYSPLMRVTFSLLLCTALSTSVIAAEILDTSGTSAVVATDQKNQQEFPLVQFRKFTGPITDLKIEGTHQYGLVDIHETLKKNYAKDFNFLNTIQAEFYEILYPTALSTTVDADGTREASHKFQEHLEKIYESFMTQIYAEFGTYHALIHTSVSEPQMQSEFLMRTHTLKNAAMVSGIYAAAAYAQQQCLGGFDLYRGHDASHSESIDNDLARYKAAAEQKKYEIEAQYQEQIDELRARQDKLSAEKEKQQNRNTQVQAPLQELDKQFRKLDTDIQTLEQECLANQNSVDQEVMKFTKEISQQHARTQSAAQRIFRSFGFTGGFKALSSAINFVMGTPDAYAHFDQLVYTYPQEALKAVQLFWATMETYEKDNPLSSDLKQFLRSHSTFEEQLEDIIQHLWSSDEAEIVEPLTADVTESQIDQMVADIEECVTHPKQSQLQKKVKKMQPKKGKGKKKR